MSSPNPNPNRSSRIYHRAGQPFVRQEVRKPQTQYVTVPCTVLYTIDDAARLTRYAHVDHNGIKGNVPCCDKVTEGPAVLVMFPAVDSTGRFFGRVYCRPVGFTWED